MAVPGDPRPGQHARDEPTEVTLPLSSGVGAPAERLVRHWGVRCGLDGVVLDRLVFAVSEIVEAAHVLATSLGLAGGMVVAVRPYSRWLTVELTMPQAIPLDPTFDQADLALQEMPGMRLMPDIFWRRVILQWVDKATWRVRADKVTVALTQYARRTGGVGELYFLALTPRPTPGLEVRRLSDELTVVASPSGKGAFKLDRRASFVLGAVDGSTAVRDIYRAFVREHGLVHPSVVGGIVEDLIARGLVVPGERLTADRPPGLAKRVLASIAHFRVSLPQPEKLFRRLDRAVGFVASPWAWLPALAFVACSVVWSGRVATVPPDVAPGPAAGPVAQLLVVVLGIYVFVVLHELAHGLALVRMGGEVRAAGLLLYYGILCAYVDTSEAWMLPSRWRRAAISLAGPLSTLLVGAVFLWGPVLAGRMGPGGLETPFRTLAVMCFTSTALNLLPFLETDGYYILVDLLDRPGLAARSFSYLGDLVARLAGKTPSRPVPADATLLVIYGVASAACVAALISVSVGATAIGIVRGERSPWLVVFVAIALIALLHRGVETATAWYRRSYLIILDLKADLHRAGNQGF